MIWGVLDFCQGRCQFKVFGYGFFFVLYIYILFMSIDG